MSNGMLSPLHLSLCHLCGACLQLASFVTVLCTALLCVAGAGQERLERVCALLQQQLRLLPAFKRKTLQAQWFWILPPDQPPQPAAATAEQQQGQGAVGGPIQLAGEPPAQVAALAAAGESGAGRTAAEAAAEARAEAEAKLREVLEALSAGREFVPAPGFVGAVAGYALKLGEQGLGYYADRPPEAVPLLTHDAVRLPASALHDQLWATCRILLELSLPAMACTVEGKGPSLLSACFSTCAHGLPFLCLLLLPGRLPGFSPLRLQSPSH